MDMVIQIIHAVEDSITQPGLYALTFNGRIWFHDFARSSKDDQEWFEMPLPPDCNKNERFEIRCYVCSERIIIYESSFDGQGKLVISVCKHECKKLKDKK